MKLLSELHKLFIKETASAVKFGAPLSVYEDEVAKVKAAALRKFNKELHGVQLHQIVVQRLSGSYSGWSMSPEEEMVMTVKDRRKEADLDRPVMDFKSPDFRAAYNNMKTGSDRLFQTFEYFYRKGYQFGHPVYDDSPIYYLEDLTKRIDYTYRRDDHHERDGSDNVVKMDDFRK